VQKQQTEGDRVSATIKFDLQGVGYRIKSHLPFASIIRTSPKSPH